LVTKTKRLFLRGLFISVVMLLSSCTLITNLETYKLVSNYQSESWEKQENVSVSISLRTTVKRKYLIPLIYKKSIQKDPYWVLIYIKGLKDIEIIQAKVKLNSGKEERIFKITRDDFEYSPLSDGTPYFFLKTKTYLDYPWKKIKDAEVVLEFYGIKNGIKTKYQARKIFKPEFESFITNDAMSI